MTDRKSAWAEIVSQCGKFTMTKAGLLSLRRAAEYLGLSAEDVESIESAIGYRHSETGELREHWVSVRRFSPAKTNEEQRA